MARKLGVSIYPEHSTKEQDMSYLTKASHYGFERVFTCLLSVNKEKEDIITDFSEIINHAKSKNIEVILDIAPAVFQKLGINYDDLRLFSELGADGIRLDVGFDGLREAKLTQNEYGLNIELNMSNDINYLENILSHQPNKDRLLGCHNFYPQRFTGLPYDFFVRCSRRFKRYGIRTAAFVTSQGGAIGPWDINDGLCTLEQHRQLPIDIQAKHLWATGCIDDVVIGNAYASDAELRLLSELNRNLIELKVQTEHNMSDVEERILFNEKHIRRGDISDYMIRSTEVRKKYQNEEFPLRTSVSQKRGQISIGNNSFGKYKGELQVILKDMPQDKRKNIIGKVVDEELFLLDYIKPWGSFSLKNKG
ncbi:hypothetical protein EV207_11688 [Scopulibacillus darangshiensis]|uniref:Outer surface protein n=1 Tax=Scopulibacillus darangshiensis TaxID=442528 RepID=A0A4V2SMW9_9BACL|nr:MupG family TIM beta-alpha barrel fold protein [Scopulibacillus darangshiensis]TCP28776.1 hypothetical protein EV207_11688 [Scopulibacillus darangshiensis]